MKIVINGRFLTQPVTGVQRYAREIVRSFDELLTEEEFSTTELVLAVSSESRIDFSLTRLPVEVVGARHVQRRPLIWEQVDLAARSRGSLLFCPANTAPLSRLIVGEPTVVTLHSISFREVPTAYSLRFRVAYRALMRAICRGAQRVITVSEAERDRILNAYPSLADRLVVVPNGEIPERWLAMPCTEPSTPPRLLFVGTLHPAKNLKILRDAFEILRKERPLELHVVGGSTGAYATPVSDAKDGDGVVYHGQVSDEAELVRLYRSASVLVHPSRYESSGLPPTEALALGRPVICSDLPILRERCGQRASYFQPDDLEALVTLVRRQLDSPVVPPTRRPLTWLDAARETLRVLVRASSGAPS